MNYARLAECFIEISQSGHYKERAAYLLLEEIVSSSELNSGQKKGIIAAIKEIQSKQAFGNSEPTDHLWQALGELQEFQAEFAKIFGSVIQRERRLLQ